MTGAAKDRVGDRGELLDLGVYLPPRLVGVGHDADDVAIVEHAREFGVPLRTIDWREQIARFQRQSSRGLVVVLANPVADHAGDALARGGMPLEVGDERVLTEIGADLIVAAQTEVAVGTVGQLVDSVVQGEVDRAELCIRVLRNRPLAILLGMTGHAGRGRGVALLGEQRLVRLFGDARGGLDLLFLLLEFFIEQQFVVVEQKVVIVVEKKIVVLRQQERGFGSAIPGHAFGGSRALRSLGGRHHQRTGIGVGAGFRGSHPPANR